MIRIKGVFLFLVAAFLCEGCASRKPEPDLPHYGVIHNHELPPLKLTAEHKQLLSSVSPTPQTALDYYALLPKSYFSVMPDSRERRVTYIDTKTLSADYLHASSWFECDGGGFDIVLRLYKSSSGTIVALLADESTKIYDGKPKEGDPSITVRKPSFWKYAGGAWAPQPRTILPDIDPVEILDRYYHHYKAHLNQRGQFKYIWLEYTLLPTTTDIHLTGRENFMDPFQGYVWKRYRWTGKRFLPL